MIIFTLRLGGARGPVSVPKNSSVWMRERRMKSLIPYQTNLPDFFYLLFLKVVHDLTNLSVSDGLCATIHTDQPHYTIGLWSISTFCERVCLCACVNTVSIYLFSFYVTAVSNMIEVSWEERVYYLLQLSALFAVLCRSSTGLPLNAIRLRLWLFAFLIIAGMLFEACDKHSTTPPLLLGCMHTQQRQCAPTNAHANVRDAHKPSLGSCLSHNMC